MLFNYLCDSVVMFCPQATTYKLDFEQERSDREKAVGRFDEEREALQADIAKLNKQLKAVQLEQMKVPSLLQKNGVRFKLHYIQFCKLTLYIWSLIMC